MRAGGSHALYRAVKYGAGRSLGLAETDRRCETAYRLYPHNVYLSIWAAEKAYYTKAGEVLTPERLAIAQRWCDRGLRQNPHKRSLRLLRTYLLMPHDPAAALEAWRRYVDWHFWDAFNHSVLAELYARNGDFFRARRSLQWTVGSRYEAETRRAIQAAWKREMRGK